MRHNVKTRTLGRKTSHRLSMLRNLATSLFLHRRITTTRVRAEELARFAEKIITDAKKGDLASKRRVFSKINDREVARQVFDLALAQYSNRNGGYTRIINIGPRKGDSAPMALIELV